MTAIKFVQARNFTRANRGPQDVSLIVIHTAECGETPKAAENLQTWTAGPNASQASWHYAVDNDSVTQSVHEKDIAWHAGLANRHSIGIELAGSASQTPAQWADAFSTATLENAAQLTARICRERSIPARRLTLDELRTKAKGFAGHVDCNAAFANGKGHTDPGKSFPWDSFLARVRALLSEAPTLPVLPEVDDETTDVVAVPEMREPPSRDRVHVIRNNVEMLAEQIRERREQVLDELDDPDDAA